MTLDKKNLDWHAVLDHLKGQFSIGTSMSQFDNSCIVINLYLVLLLWVEKYQKYL